MAIILKSLKLVCDIYIAVSTNPSTLYPGLTVIILLLWPRIIVQAGTPLRWLINNIVILNRIDKYSLKNIPLINNPVKILMLSMNKFLME